jgi:hypothetical protein
MGSLKYRSPDLQLFSQRDCFEANGDHFASLPLHRSRYLIAVPNASAEQKVDSNLGWLREMIEETQPSKRAKSSANNERWLPNYRSARLLIGTRPATPSPCCYAADCDKTSQSQAE